MKNIKLIKDSNIIDKDFLIEYLEDKHLSYSSLKEALQILEEMEKIKRVEIKKYLQDLKLDKVEDRKNRGVTFLEKLRRERYPFKYKVLDKLNSEVDFFKKKAVNIEYPQNLEGDKIKLSFEISNSQELREKLDFFENHRYKLDSILEIIKRGY